MISKLIVKCISTFFGVGYSKFMPGTMGSLAAIPIAFFGLAYSNIVQLAIVIFISIIGFIAVKFYIENNPNKDPKEVVIDEVLGQVITIFLTKYAYTLIQSHLNTKGLGIFLLFTASFLSFRFFDITKIWPIKVIDTQMKNYIGVMMDDVLAAIFASILSITFITSISFL